MKSKSLVLIAVSLGFGLVAAIGISQVLGRNNNPPPTPKQELKPILVAQDHLDAFGELVETKIAVEKWPASLVPPDALSSIEETKDKVVNCRVAKKMPILKQMVVHRNEVNRLAIPKNYKVMGIKLPADDVLSGLLSPGDVVDLIGVFTNDKTKVSRTFLTNIRVFSVNNKTAPDQDRGKSGSQGAVVGVLLTKGQAEKLILAQKVAQIKLVLRSQESDSNAIAATEVDDRDGVSTDDFSEDNHVQEQPKPDNDESFLGRLLQGRTESQISHQMVMVTPDGPVSYVFHKDSPVPQRIDGYLNPEPARISMDSSGEANPSDETTTTVEDSVESDVDSVDADETEPTTESDDVDSSDSVVDDQEDQFNAP
jgi:Flp pilus assembly protein CpaB